MNNDIVTFEVAKLAKEKGFMMECDHYYENSLTESIDEQDGKSGPFGWEKGEINLGSGYFINNYVGIDCSGENWFLCAAPRKASLQRWLRENHKINIMIAFKPNIKKWDFITYDMNMSGKEYIKYYSKYAKEHNRRIYETYEDALEDGLREGLNIIKENFEN